MEQIQQSKGAEKKEDAPVTSDKRGVLQMREKKYAAMSRKMPLDVDALTVLNAYCLKDDPCAISKLKAYGLQSSDLDVMNHLMLINKMKPKALAAIKKKLKGT